MAEKNVPAKKGAIAKFFRETKAELKKVTWPSKKQLVHNTIIILGFIVVIGIILAALDIGFSWLFKLLATAL